ncbi:MAG: helix-turn-helix transcriptional regulator [Desulfobacteraceae bacterium]|nr:helix-turn-helix transcriptional regulator [Desulfobacteraceae bacterium]
MPTTSRPINNKENIFETYSSWPKKIGKSNILEINLRNGLKLMVENYQLVGKHISDGKVDSPQLSFAFCASGKSRATVQGEKKELISTPGQNYISFCPDPRGTLECLSREPVTFVSVLIEPSFLKRFPDDLPNRFPNDFIDILNGCKNTFYNRKGLSTGHIQMTIHQILNCPYQGALRQMYLESKAIELITHQLAQLASENKDSKKIRLNSGDIERIHEARNILIKNMEKPPSLTELSRQVGLNDKKLKYGFKQVFNTTAFGYLRTHRLELGRQFLTDGKMNISEVSYKVGYSERTHFTRAFTKHFGCSPQSYLHNNKAVSDQTCHPALL